MLDEIYLEPEKRHIDFSTLSLHGRSLPAKFVQSTLLWKTDNPTFARIIERIEAQAQPGFFFAPEEEGDVSVRVRPKLNRHGIISSEELQDDQGIYRDVDVKGMGLVRGMPMRVIPLRLPEMRGDMEVRGLLHYETGNTERLNYLELSEIKRLRLGHIVAQVELFEMIDRHGNIVPRDYFGNEFGLRMDLVRPIQITRVMGTTARVNNISAYRDSSEPEKRYEKELIDDAMRLVSREVGYKLSARDYVRWFVDTLAEQLAAFHQNDSSPDWRMQIHGGKHNVTLDCRCVDLSRCETPASIERKRRSIEEYYERYPEHRGDFDGPVQTAAQREENNRKVEQADRNVGAWIAADLAEGVRQFYPKVIERKKAEDRFNAAYKRAR